MSKDTIYREDAINVVEEIETMRLKGQIDLTYAPTIKRLKSIPSADRPQGWIPCKERLPEDGEIVLVWDNDRFPDVKYVICRYSKNYGFYDYDHGAFIAECDGANAWMPLPEPYKKGESNE